MYCTRDSICLTHKNVLYISFTKVDQMNLVEKLTPLVLLKSGLMYTVQYVCMYVYSSIIVIIHWFHTTIQNHEHTYQLARVLFYSYTFCIAAYDGQNIRNICTVGGFGRVCYKLAQSMISTGKFKIFLREGVFI